MTPVPSKGLRRLILAFKWGGCCTALVFALGGLLLDIASAGEAYEVLSRGSWFIVAISMAFGFRSTVSSAHCGCPCSGL